MYKGGHLRNDVFKSSGFSFNKLVIAGVRKENNILFNLQVMLADSLLSIISAELYLTLIYLLFLHAELCVRTL